MKIACSIILFILLITLPCRAQNAVNYAVHANIIYRFTKYLKWPDNKTSGEFVIGVVGSSPLYNELKNFIANKTVGNQKIVLKQFLSTSNSYNCHMLFITEDAVRSFKKIVLVTAHDPILILSEGDELARKGSCINFNVEDEHLKLEINKNNIEDRNLNIATELLSLGVIVK